MLNNNMSVVQPTNAFSFIPTNLTEAMEYASLLAKSTMVPRCYQGKPSEVLIAIQLGAELGLKPLQSLQNIATINGRPCIWGDAMLALVQATAIFEDIKEHYDEEKKAAVCTVKRKNQTEHTVIFSEEDAKKAGLWGKSNTPWVTYPKRMLQMRARGFALRDKFADALGGLITAEEAQDYPVDVTPKKEQNGKVISFNEFIESEQNIKSEQNKNSLIKEYMQLCVEQEINPKEFAGKHNITSTDLESIKNGIKLLMEKQNEYITGKQTEYKNTSVITSVS